MSFLQAGDDAKAASDKVVFAPDPTALSRALYVSPRQTREISLRNPWAAAALLAIQDAGEFVELRSGRTLLSSLPTHESMQALLDGDATALKAATMPGGLIAAVTYRLERGPGPVATLIMSSVAMDEDGRTLFKAYPDVSLQLAEHEASVGGAREKDSEGAASKHFIAHAWATIE